MVDYPVSPVSVSLLSWKSWFSPITPPAVWRVCVIYIHRWAVTVCRLLPHTQVAIRPTNIRPLHIGNIVRFTGRSLAFSDGDVESYRSVTKCHLIIPKSCSWKQQSYPWPTWRRPHQKKTTPFSVSQGKRVFLQLPWSGVMYHNDISAVYKIIVHSPTSVFFPGFSQAVVKMFVDILTSFLCYSTALC